MIVMERMVCYIVEKRLRENVYFGVAFFFTFRRMY